MYNIYYYIFVGSLLHNRIAGRTSCRSSNASGISWRRHCGYRLVAEGRWPPLVALAAAEARAGEEAAGVALINRAMALRP
jgi:hypothetical protein